MKVIKGGLSERGASAGDKAEHPFGERGESLVGKIASEIASRIVDGSLPAGADLNTVELASRFGTSRTPVREALMLLEKEGLVEIPPRRRPRVANITWRDIEEMYQIRAHLNALMMRLFTTHASETALQESRAKFERMKACAARGDIEGFIAERMRLQDYWGEECGNATLQTTLKAWRSRLSLRRMAATKAEHVERSIIDHHRLLIACEERDGELAAALIQSMTLAGLEAIRQAGWSDPAGRRSPRN